VKQFDRSTIAPDMWIPWTAAASLVRFMGRTIRSDLKHLNTECRLINNQSCVLWSEVLKKSTPKVSESERRLKDVGDRLNAMHAEYQALRRVYEGLVEKVSDEERLWKETHPND
jgi:hypothetical protein